MLVMSLSSAFAPFILIITSCCIITSRAQYLSVSRFLTYIIISVLAVFVVLIHIISLVVLLLLLALCYSYGDLTTLPPTIISENTWMFLNISCRTGEIQVFLIEVQIPSEIIVGEIIVKSPLRLSYWDFTIISPTIISEKQTLYSNKYLTGRVKFKFSFPKFKSLLEL